jgi:transcriptional regulator with XRE-family HTH domain
VSELLNTLKRAIRKGNKSRYRLAQATGIAESALSRLMSGERGLSIEAAERLATALELEIIIRPTKHKADKTKGR